MSDRYGFTPCITGTHSGKLCYGNTGHVCSQILTVTIGTNVTKVVRLRHWDISHDIHFSYAGCPRKQRCPNDQV